MSTCPHCPSDVSMKAEIEDLNRQVAEALHAQEELTTALNIACALNIEQSNPETVTEQKMMAQKLAVEMIDEIRRKYGRERNAEVTIVKTYRNFPGNPVELEA